MHRMKGPRGRILAATAGFCVFAAAGPEARAIEMFTFFGDGSRVGLPSLEVPIEAYPGIPLRSDRLRARRSGRMPPQGTMGPFRGQGITLRVQPLTGDAAVEQVPAPIAAPTGPAR